MPIIKSKSTFSAILIAGSHPDGGCLLGQFGRRG